MCGENLTEDSGRITQPHISMTDTIDKYLSCEWTIFAKPNKSIHFEIVFVRIDDIPPCYEFYLIVSDTHIFFFIIRLGPFSFQYVSWKLCTRKIFNMFSYNPFK